MFIFKYILTAINGFYALLILLSGFLFYPGIITTAQISANRSASLDPLVKARDFVAHRQWEQAKPILQDLFSRSSGGSSNREEILYLLAHVKLMQQDPEGVEHARQLSGEFAASLRTVRIAYELGNYYFYQQDYNLALEAYEQTNATLLTNEEIAFLKFRQAYSYFDQRMYVQAKPLFNTIRQLSEDPNQSAAHYYYAYICYSEKNYPAALESFEKVQSDPYYGKKVPYYLASIYYMRGEKEKAIRIGEKSLGKGQTAEELELKQLMGHAYFEQKEFKKAEPLLEAYYKQASRVSREQLYELSYCYYSNAKLTNAADGLKQLSEGADSLSQNAMYLLGDIYLQTGQKESARSAFAFCAGNSSNPEQKEVSAFFYSKLSFDLGFQGIAIQELKKFIQDYPDSRYQSEGKELLAALLGNTNNYKDALHLIESLDELSEDTKKLYPRLLFGRAVELMNDQQYLKADILIDQILSDPYGTAVYPYAHFWKGELLYRGGELSKAAFHFQQFIQAGTPAQGQVTIQDASYQLGYCYYRTQQFDKALTAFQKVTGKPGVNATLVQQDAYLRQGDCHYMLRQFSTAQTIYQAILDAGWSSSDYALYQKALITGITKSSGKIRLLENLQQQFPKSGLVMDANMEIASTYLSDEQFQSAIPFLQKVIAVSGNSFRPSALFQLGTVHYNLNNNNEALNVFQQLIKEYPASSQSADAFTTIRAIYVELGKPMEYEAFLKKNGRTVNELEADSLAYESFLIQVEKDDCSSIIKQGNAYIERFSSGVHKQEIYYRRSICYQKDKSWKNALDGFELVAGGANTKEAEQSALYGARIAYFELQDLKRAQVLYTRLYQLTSDLSNKTEALRGQLRCLYKLKTFSEAQPVAVELINIKSIGNDDKSLCNLVMGYAQQQKGAQDAAIQSFRQTIQLNQGEWAAEARYQTAKIYFDKRQLEQSEKAAFEVVNKSGSYEYWVARAYLLLGDIYFQQKDYFNAKATFQSVSENTSIEELKNEAQTKLQQTQEEEKKNSKLEQ